MNADHIPAKEDEGNSRTDRGAIAEVIADAVVRVAILGLIGWVAWLVYAYNARPHK